MTTMRAAVVTEFGRPPQYGEIEEPRPGDGEQLVDVLAVAVHPRTRSGAAGTHYTATGTLPMVPGIDGVARTTDGGRVYFAAGDGPVGTLAERAVLNPRRAVALPDGADAATVAATMNPAMSSWVTLRRRVALREGQSVLVLGATGNAGTMAVRVARRLGAGQIVAAGRDPERLAALSALGADGLVRLGADAAVTSVAIGDAAADVDIVLDYLWGTPASAAMEAILTARADRGRALHWVQIGAIAGRTIELPSAWLRSANLRVLGSGQGSVPGADYVAELPSLIAEIDAGTLALTPDTAPLADVNAAWQRAEVAGRRLVLVP